MNAHVVYKIITNDHYLGLPLMFDRSHSKDLQFVFDKIQASVTHWNNKHLNYVRKEVLIIEIF